jgi:hypothetical protein
MTPTLIAELRDCVRLADDMHAHFLAERLRQVAEALEGMTLLPVAALTPPPRGKPNLLVVNGPVEAGRRPGHAP